MTIANPIYDSVFKYLMEDTRIARTILSALMKKDLVSVQVRPHEYANSQHDTLSMFRIDFAATVRNADGSEQLILIEVQKTWLETETLRFRQYLGVQYERKENITADSREDYAMPMVAVYILGHKVGDIEEPVLYVHHHAYDYDERPVTKGLPNPFIDSLTHDSIIVQIPRLRGQLNTRLDRVLSVFDQTRQAQQSQHFLHIDDNLFADDDPDMQPILRRLLMAAADADKRMDMNVEDEYYSILEKRETEIMVKDLELERQSEKIAQQDAQIAEKSAQIAQQDAQIAEKSAQIAQQELIIGRTVKMLLGMGASVKDIAATLGKDVAEVEGIIRNLENK